RIYNNTIINAMNAISVSGGTGFTFTNNTANIGSLGLQLYNTTIDTLQNNRLLNMSNFGIVCGMNSQGQSTSLNRDLGGNVCSSNGACNWMTSSSYCAPH
ncbi:MAG: hypothetical protein KGH77_06305, partial [Candidatus Micrarchaeota archaeon]|nr:hypothetical protein [Candidatus Micrarchaeota archaeon]